MVSDFEEFDSLCFNVKLHGTSKSLWLISIATSCRSVWLARNEMVFERKVLSMDTLIFHSKMRALLWVRFQSCYMGWHCPPHGWLNFNISWMTIGEAMGYGGVLRDEEGNVRALFSGPCDAIDVDSSELRAIITTLDVIIEIRWRGTGLIIFEIGSLVAYNWLLNKHKRPWLQQATFVDMERRLAYEGEVAFSKAE
ncbi:hypothetical protein PVK06_010788 [Gossypium arboreum]|uniref:RNase H type-1 domain-containing protein n=1 Tax=Gossypium arboreum TaxID=29729 RepID=A0ABR0Q7T4_GOSAR|nr:hypothetical protein PVK06_010788 [Gossypium arboreum]